MGNPSENDNFRNNVFNADLRCVYMYMCIVCSIYCEFCLNETLPEPDKFFSPEVVWFRQVLMYEDCQCF